MGANMAAKTIEKKVVELETRYWKAIQEQDADTALRLTDDPCIVTGAQGVGRIGHQALGGMLRAAPWKLHEFELSNVQVHMLRDDVGVVAYDVKEVLTVEGKPVTLQAVDTSTWVRTGRRWVCAVHTEAIVGDPFGRDRRPMKKKRSPSL